MYNAYSEKNDNPVFRTFMYMTLVQFFLVGAFLIFLEKFLIVGNVLSEIDVDTIKRSSIFWGAIILAIFVFTHMYFFRREASYYEDMFSHCHTLNRTVKIWMLIVFPFLVFFISINIYIFLFGGTILGKEVIGIME